MPHPTTIMSPGASVEGDDVPVSDGDRLPRGRAHRPQEAAHAARAAPPRIRLLPLRRTTAIPHRAHLQVSWFCDQTQGNAAEICVLLYTFNTIFVS